MATLTAHTRTKESPATEPDANASFTLPLSALTWDGFREWATSDRFPEQGRISFLGNEVYVDMSAERLNSHVEPKGAIFYALKQYEIETKSGRAFLDGVLVSHKAATLSTEPDVLFVRNESLARGTVTFKPTADRKDHIELLGSPDLVVEIVSPSSVKKDYHTLRDIYHAAGVAEYWTIDVREDVLVFDLLVWHEQAYVLAEDRDGWLHSPVLGRDVQLTIETADHALNRATLTVRATAP